MRRVVVLVTFLLAAVLSAGAVLLTRAGAPATLEAELTRAACGRLAGLESAARKASASRTSALLARARAGHCEPEPEPCRCLVNYNGPDSDY